MISGSAAVGDAAPRGQNWLPNAVNSSGADSPATRAIAKQRARDDAGPRHRHRDQQRRLPRGNAERKRAFADHGRDQAYRFFGGAHDDRQHDDRERHGR